MKNRGELRRQLPLNNITTLPYLNKQAECECPTLCATSPRVGNQIIQPCGSHLIWCSPVHTEGLIKHSGSLHLSSSLSLPSSFHLVPFFSDVLSLLLQCYSLKRQIVRTGNEGIVLCNRNKCPPGNDSSCSRLPGRLRCSSGQLLSMCETGQHNGLSIRLSMSQVSNSQA